MSSPRFVVGIDLGTTNSAVAYVDLNDSERRVAQLPIPQLVLEATMGEQPNLPSFLYVGGEHDIAPGALALPWDKERNYAVGELARLQGARVPGRLVSSAKSWLCHGGVDREAAILPWGASEDVTKLSPVEVSSRYLQHLREVWGQRFPEAPLAAQSVILTVPASFDEVARELTVQAAERAGLTRVVLIEEPQAAFYAWLHRHETTWEQLVESSNLAVVIDVGGGTTDFSLIKVGRDDGKLALERLAVGDHLLLGGDNIDVALARMLEPRLGAKLDTQRWHALVSICRSAKEALLGDEPPDEMPIRLVGRGRAVVGGVLTATLKRSEVEGLVLNGFFPATGASDLPRRSQRAGLQEFGLPFANEAEVSRHLAGFFAQHCQGAESSALPDAILFNGGALKPALIRTRLRELLAVWRGDQQPLVLDSPDLDLAVARGAAYYGLVRRGRGVRIGGGTARSYYIGVGGSLSAAADVAVDAASAEAGATITALCLAPRGMHEGEQIEISDRDLQVVTNRGVSFPLYASSTRLGDVAGALIAAPREALTIMPPIRTVLRFGKKLSERTIPVHLLAHLTEVGTLEVSCRSLSTEHRWRLQFQLRDQNAPEEAAAAEQGAEAVIADERMRAAEEALRAVFPTPGGTAAGGTAASGDPVALTRALEERLGMSKEAWPLAAIRKLWDVLWENQQQRALSALHEARWLNLCGFLLRPGFGAQLDELRVQQLWRLKSAGPAFPKAAQVRAEWWNLWKRIAGGLGRQQQMQLHTEVAPYLLPNLKSKAKGPKPGPQELREYWQLMGSCERLSAEMKAALGEALLPALLKGKATEAELWALGRLGARAPIYGPLNCVVARAVAAKWIEALLGITWAKPEGSVFLLVQLARCVGDRERDLDEALRQRVATRVATLPHGQRAARVVTEAVPLEAHDRARILDESLPVGLQLRMA